MAVLYGTQSDGTLIPVQADSQGRLVAELANRDTAPSYQDGTWIPIVQTTNGGFDATYDLQAGQFMRVGQWVTVNFQIHNVAIASIGSGSLAVGNVPYLPDSVGTVPQYSGVLTNKSKFDTGFVPEFVVVRESASNANILLMYWRVAEDFASGIASTKISPDFELQGSVTYRTADTSFAPINGASLR